MSISNHREKYITCYGTKIHICGRALIFMMSLILIMGWWTFIERENIENECKVRFEKEEASRWFHSGFQ